MSRTRHRRRADSDVEFDEDEFLQFRSPESNPIVSKESSLRSLRFIDSQDSLPGQESQQSRVSLRSDKSHISVHSEKSHISIRSSQQSAQSAAQSAAGIPHEFDYLFRSSQNDDNVLALDADSPVTISIGVVCVVERQASDNNPEIKPHTLQKTFYSYPKNADAQVKKQIEERIENDVADFKLQGYHVTIYTFGLPFVVEEICNISRGYDGKTKMLRAARKKNTSGAAAAESSTSDVPGASGAFGAVPRVRGSGGVLGASDDLEDLFSDIAEVSRAANKRKRSKK